jgi:hypothetical protein
VFSEFSRLTSRVDNRHHSSSFFCSFGGIIFNSIYLQSVINLPYLPFGLIPSIHYLSSSFSITSTMLRSSSQRLRLASSCYTYTSQRTTVWRRHFLSTTSSNTRPFDKVLIANRGEIACRVIRTCQRLQIPTVALYSVADGPMALHARMADEAYPIGTGPTPTESYLLQEDVLEICERSGAQAIHPGYV